MAIARQFHWRELMLYTVNRTVDTREILPFPMFQPYLRNLVLLCSRDAQIVLYGVTVKTTLLDSVPPGVTRLLGVPRLSSATE